MLVFSARGAALHRVFACSQRNASVLALALLPVKLRGWNLNSIGSETRRLVGSELKTPLTGENVDAFRPLLWRADFVSG